MRVCPGACMRSCVRLMSVYVYVRASVRYASVCVCAACLCACVCVDVWYLIRSQSLSIEAGLLPGCKMFAEKSTFCSDNCIFPVAKLGTILQQQNHFAVIKLAHAFQSLQRQLFTAAIGYML